MLSFRWAVARVEREEVLAKLRERIVRFAASHISRDVAEDLAQEVLMLLHEKYAHLERTEDLLPLSLQIVRFKIMSLRRKTVRRGEYTQGVQGGSRRDAGATQRRRCAAISRRS